ncbi:unnamed protein product [Linum trigynum]|uniref:Uncharacterized protein n=1 Tax=Linum trigynum TaxID=586398 RepID=A0AAV2FSA2_9ROSI
MNIMKDKFGVQEMKLLRTKPFRKHIGNLFLRRYLLRSDITRCRSLPYEVAVHFNVLCALIKNRVGGYMRATWLSQYNGVESGLETPNSLSNHQSQMSSLTVLAMARYSASEDERATTNYFFVRQKIGLSPSRRKYPVVERRVR